MPRGGLREGTKVESNHLFKPKWALGKTVAIRIPEILKDKLMEVARYLDSKSKNEIKNLNITDEIKINDQLNNKVFKLHNENVKLNQKLEMLISINQELNKQLKAIRELNKYQLATECFEEFLKNQSLDTEDLSKSRKGTKKYQLYEISQWLNKKSVDINVLVQRQSDDK